MSLDSKESTVSANLKIDLRKLTSIHLEQIQGIDKLVFPTPKLEHIKVECLDMQVHSSVNIQNLIVDHLDYITFKDRFSISKLRFRFFDLDSNQEQQRALLS